MSGILVYMKYIPFTDEEQAIIVARHKDGASCRKIATELGTYRKRVINWLKKNGYDVVASQYAPGSLSPWFKGGDTVHKNGYAVEHMSTDDPFYCMAYANGTVPKHRIVMARHLGRPLETYETVHHIDGDKLNNDIENLQLRKGPHGRGAQFICLDCGSHNVVAEKLPDIRLKVE